MDNELYHHGIKGQKWGVRRYQNPDGTLTVSGKKRYQRAISELERDAHEKKIMRAVSSIGTISGSIAGGFIGGFIGVPIGAIAGGVGSSAVTKASLLIERYRNKKVAELVKD